MTSPFLDALRGHVVVIVRLEDLSCAVDLTQALLVGGIRVIEFPLTHPAALGTIRILRGEIPHFSDGRAFLGTGSVLTSADAKASIAAGTQFIVSPVADLATIQTCVDHAIPAIPGALTPSEILTAHRAGASAVKIFPARQLGPTYIKELLEPLPFLKLLPTCGITADNARAYLQAGAFALGVGSALLDKPAIARREWGAITAQARRFSSSCLPLDH
jgi:2-dehydro-3-deoxyphosphogluconate aldolase/(4S)-4-hydroxy-2-oxoglutarate aldolase